jgi:nitric oxide dioxygenase
MPLTPAQTAIIKATVPILEAGGVALTSHFYKMMLTEHESVRPLFNPAHQHSGAQPKALANAVLQYAKCIDCLDKLPAELVPQIVHKHVALNVLPEHYPIVGGCLLRSIREVLGAETATDAVLDAWGAAYGQLADILIGAEEGVYKAHAEAPGGWRGTRPFRIARKVKESDGVTSFYLEPVDGQPVLAAEAGQYLGLNLALPLSLCPGASAALQCPASAAKIKVVDSNFLTRRNYSLSAATDAQSTGYRISVKRVDGGAASQWLHDTTVEGETILEVFAPSGPFTIAKPAQDKASAPRALLLMSAGVGITPILSMLQAHAAAEQKAHAVTHFIHSTQSGATHAFREEVARAMDVLKQRGDGSSRAYYCYSSPRAGVDVEGRDYHSAGRLDAARLKEWMPVVAGSVPPSNVDAYFVGPKEYMRDMRDALLSMNVPAENLHWEFFGPAGKLE